MFNKNVSKKKERFNIRSIRVKLVLMLISICQIPLIAFGVITYKNSNDILYNKLKTTANQELGIADVAINNYFNGISTNTELLANNSDLKEITLHPENETNVMSLVKQLKDNNKNIEQIIFSTVDKKVIRYPEKKADPSYNPLERPWYKSAASNEGNITFTEPYKSTTGKTVVSICKTVTNNGSVIGVVSVDVDLSDLSKDLSKIRLGETGYIFISDSKGYMVSHPDSSLIGGDTATKQTYWDEMKSNPRGFVSYTYNNEKKYAGYATNAITGWKLVGNMKESELLKDSNSIKKLLILFFIVALPLNIFIASIFSKSINTNIIKLKAVFNKAAAGDLTHKVSINSKDEFQELGESFNNMKDGICKLIGRVKASADIIDDTSLTISTMSNQTASAVEDIARSIDQVASGTTDQAKNIEDGVSQLQSLVNKLQHIRDNSRSMYKVSKDTDNLVNDGLNVMNLLSVKSHDAEDASNAIEFSVKAMSEAADNIKAITESINSIAEQTNLLALNAAIEAARAGEAGRGFSIVAEEIRTLSEESTNATKNIAKLIEQVEEKSKDAVNAVKVAKSTVYEQGIAVDNTKITFNDISDSIDKLSHMIASVEHSIEAINKDKDSIMENMQSLSAISEETAASTEEVSAATEEVSASMEDFDIKAKKLKDLSSDLEESVNKFNI